MLTVNDLVQKKVDRILSKPSVVINIRSITSRFEKLLELVYMMKKGDVTERTERKLQKILEDLEKMKIGDNLRYELSKFANTFWMKWIEVGEYRERYRELVKNSKECFTESFSRIFFNSSSDFKFTFFVFFLWVERRENTSYTTFFLKTFKKRISSNWSYFKTDPYYLEFFNCCTQHNITIPESLRDEFYKQLGNLVQKVKNEFVKILDNTLSTFVHRMNNTPTIEELRSNLYVEMFYNYINNLFSTGIYDEVENNLQKFVKNGFDCSIPVQRTMNQELFYLSLLRYNLKRNPDRVIIRICDYINEIRI